MRQACSGSCVALASLAGLSAGGAAIVCISCIKVSTSLETIDANLGDWCTLLLLLVSCCQRPASESSVHRCQACEEKPRLHPGGAASMTQPDEAQPLPPPDGGASAADGDQPAAQEQVRVGVLRALARAMGAIPAAIQCSVGLSESLPCR